MSFKYTDLVTEHSATKGPDRAIMLVLALHANKDTGECWPSLSRIARHSGLTKRTVRRRLSKIENMGELRIKRRSHILQTKGGKQQSNLYQITLPPPKGRDRPSPPMRRQGGDTAAPKVGTLCPQGGDTASPEPKENHKNEPKEERKKFREIEISDYSDIHNPVNDPIDLACTITGERTDFAVNTWNKKLRKVGDKRFRDHLVLLWGEMKPGNTPIHNPGALLTKKLEIASASDLRKESC